MVEETSKCPICNWHNNMCICHFLKTPTGISAESGLSLKCGRVYASYGRHLDSTREAFIILSCESIL